MREEIFNRNSKDFMDRLLSIKNRRKLCDAVLIVNGKKIFAHANILASCSYYFENEFINKTAPTKELIFNDINEETFQQIIEYCYTGSIRITKDNAADVIKIANFLIIPEIIERSSQLLKRNLNVNNCLSMWKFASSEHIEILENVSLEYARKYFTEISHSQEFLTLEYSYLNTLFDFDVNVASEKIIYKAIKNWVNHDNDTRTGHFVDLLDHVKLGCLPHDFLLSESQLMCSTDGTCFSKYIKAAQMQDKDKSKYCTRLNSTVIAVGEQSPDKSKRMEIFDLVNKEWIEVHNANCNKGSFSTVLMNDKLILIGGSINSALNTIESYDLRTGKVESLPSMNHKRFHTSAVEFQGCIYVIGGYNADFLSSVEKWDPLTGSWKDLASMPTSRYGCAAKALNEKIYVVGGYNNRSLAVTEAYDSVTDKWIICNPMKEMRIAPGIAVVSGYLYAVGGNNGKLRVTTAEKYDPQIDKWTWIQSTAVARDWLAAANLMGQLVIAGGFLNDEKENVSSVEEYNEENEKWLFTTPLKNPRSVFDLVEVPWKLAEYLINRKKS